MHSSGPMMIVNRKMKTLVMTSACDRHVEMGTKTWHGLLGCQGEPVTDMVRDCVFVAMTGGIGWRRPWAVVSIGMCGWVVGGGGWCSFRPWAWKTKPMVGGGVG